ncbi:MAG TPA: hypothetical protein PL009_07730 [Flavipsychrobacter sp.]|nr:hypothetical protein [Flavipsychrobacter sp.]
MIEANKHIIITGLWYKEQLNNSFFADKYVPLAILEIFRSRILFWEEETDKGNILCFFNPISGRSYLVSREKENYFLKKYFPYYLSTKRTPTFASFSIPFPQIQFSHEKDQLAISINKFPNNHYLPIFSSSLQDYISLGYRNSRTHPEENCSDTFFFKSFSEALNFGVQYQNYLATMLCSSPSSFDIGSLLVPYFELTENEAVAIVDKMYELIKIDEDEAYSDNQMQLQLQKERNQEQFYNEQFFNGFLEGDSQNMFNID